MNFDWKFSQAAVRMNSSIIREILKLLDKVNVISLAGGVPDPRLLPLEKIAEATKRVLKDDGVHSLQYSITEGYIPLREFLAERLNKQGITADTSNIIITNGSQQGLDLVGKLFINPGDVVITEHPTYLGLIQSFTTYGADFCSLPIDEQGLQIGLLEEALRKNRPVLIYTLPNFQNPAGVTLPLDRRQKLAELAIQYQVPVLEDDPYGELRYCGEPLPTIKSLACAENTILLGTISKTITPGHRLGWVVAHEKVIKKLVLAKQAVDLHSNTFSQRVIYEYCREGHLDQHIQFLRRKYGEKRDTMLTAIKKYFPAGIKWTEPEGGLFLWVTLPEGTSSSELLKESIKRGVAFVPGSAFFTDGSGENTLRLSFSNASLEDLESGIKRLADALKHQLVAT